MTINPKPSLPSRNAGFSLIEMMIAVALGVVVILGLMQVFASNVRTSTNTVMNTKMTQELRAVMDIMTREIRRSGYWANASTAVAGNVNPHGVEQVTATCILYRYDNDANVNEQRGFRLNGNTIEWQRSNNNNCNGGQWTAITESSVVSITALTFTEDANTSTCTNVTTDNDCNPCTAATAVWAVNDILLYSRRVDITLTATLTNDPAVSLTLQESVQVRNPETGRATAAGPGDTSLCGSKLPLQV